MARDPLAGVVDAPLFIVPRVLDGLRAYRARAKFGDDPVMGAQLSALLDPLVDSLLAELAHHPTKFWVMRQFQKALEQAAGLGAREPLAGELEVLMGILGIRSSDGLLGSDRR